MNAIADMVIEGIICKDCGEFIDGEAPGYERSCGCLIEEASMQNSSFVEKIKNLIGVNKK